MDIIYIDFPLKSEPEFPRVLQEDGPECLRPEGKCFHSFVTLSDPSLLCLGAAATFLPFLRRGVSRQQRLTGINCTQFRLLYFLPNVYDRDHIHIYARHLTGFRRNPQVIKELFFASCTRKCRRSYFINGLLGY